MEQENTILTEIIQTQRDKYCIYLPSMVDKENWPGYKISLSYRPGRERIRLVPCVLYACTEIWN